MSNKIQPIRLKWRKKSSKILQSYLVSPVPAESLKKMKSEENKKIEIHIYVKISARTGERSYFYQIFMRRKQAIPLQGSELFYKAEKKYRWRLFELPRYVVSCRWIALVKWIRPKWEKKYFFLIHLFSNSLFLLIQL